LIFEDEASFRQDPSLYQTWTPRGEQPRIPTTGQRHTQKIFGAVARQPSRFHFRQDTVCNGQTYAQFLEQLAGCYPHRQVLLIHDNVAYPRAPEVRDRLGRHQRFNVTALPAYSPEFNAVEPLWHHTRLQATHNRYDPETAQFIPSLKGTLRDMARHPNQIAGYLQPFL
jgi:transposase